MVKDVKISAQDIAKGLTVTLKEALAKYEKSVELLAKKEAGVNKNAVEGYAPAPSMAMAEKPEEKHDYIEGKHSKTCKSCGDFAKKLNKAIPEKLPDNGKVANKERDIKDKNKESKKSEDWISLNNSNDPEKRLVNKGKAGVTPDDKKSKVIEAEGSGGDIKKGKGLKKSEELNKNLALPGMTPPAMGLAIGGIKLPGAHLKKKPALPSMTNFQSIAGGGVTLPGNKARLSTPATLSTAAGFGATNKAAAAPASAQPPTAKLGKPMGKNEDEAIKQAFAFAETLSKNSQ